jgi:hypothetical protein
MPLGIEKRRCQCNDVLVMHVAEPAKGGFVFYVNADGTSGGGLHERGDLFVGGAPAADDDPR